MIIRLPFPATLTLKSTLTIIPVEMPYCSASVATRGMTVTSSLKVTLTWMPSSLVVALTKTGAVVSAAMETVVEAGDPSLTLSGRVVPNAIETDSPSSSSLS